MFLIEDGRKQFFQWDVNRRLIIEDGALTQVHFCNRTDDCSLVVEVYVEGNKFYADVPNILLQTDWDIRVYGYDSNYTKFSKTFNVVARTKPADYVYTETEVLNYENLIEWFDNEIYVGTEAPTSPHTKLWINPADYVEYATKQYVNKAIEDAIADMPVNPAYPNGDEVSY